MKVVYSFYGPLPWYSVSTVKQMRLFYDGDIYFILSDLESPFLPFLRDLNVQIIPFQDVEDKAFTALQTSQYEKFCYCHNLKGREELFLRSIERFFLLHNLMLQKSLTDVFFIELDNLVYASPEIWAEAFSKKDMAYMYDNHERCSSGICYVKHTGVLKQFLDLMTERVTKAEVFLNEMRFLYDFWMLHPDLVQILPTHWPDSCAPVATYDTFGEYGNTLFDSLPYGVFLTGIEPCHSYNILTKGLKAPWCAIDCTKYTFVWRKDSVGRKIPYVLRGTQELQLNNLHVHSKDILPYLSDEPLA